MKSRHEEVISIQAILNTRYHFHSDMWRAANQVATLNHHSMFGSSGNTAHCTMCAALLRMVLYNDPQISGPASDFTCEQITSMRKGEGK